MPRGRRPHPDILTPREWEVLALIRDGLTNEQIAERLGITLAGSRYHVSEILGKLDVESRQEAALWPGRPGRLLAFGLPAALFGRLRSLSPLRLAGMTVIGAAAVALIALLLGVTLLDSREPAESPEEPAEAYTGIEELDGIIDSLLHDDAAGLATQFAGVGAREGHLIGGPVGLYDEQLVSTAEWTQRLTTVDRRLHAVAVPVEPDNPPPIPGVPSQSSAVLFEGRRDYDIVLLAAPETEDAHAWRFSIAGGRVIDVIIENIEPTDNTPSLGPFSLRPRLSYLLPSPHEEAARFVVLPPLDLWPVPTVVATSEELLRGRLLDTFAAILFQGNPAARESLKVESLEKATWLNVCLEALRPDTSCPPASIDGFRATISYRGELTYLLHSDGTLSKVYWVPEQVGRGEVVELTGSGWVIAGDGELFADTIDPGRLEVVIVDGTEFYTPKSDIRPGSIVEIGVARFLSSDLVALVWIR